DRGASRDPGAAPPRRLDLRLDRDLGATEPGPPVERPPPLGAEGARRALGPPRRRRPPPGRPPAAPAPGRGPTLPPPPPPRRPPRPAAAPPPGGRAPSSAAPSPASRNEAAKAVPGLFRSSRAVVGRGRSPSARGRRPCSRAPPAERSCALETGPAPPEAPLAF